MTSKYLIVGPSWVGDMVMAQSLMIDLKQHEPDATIDVLAPAWTAALTDRMPEVDRLVSANFKHGKFGLGERIKLAKSLRVKRYTHAIVLPNSLKSALVPWLARIPIRTGFIGEQRWGLLNDIRRLNKSCLPMTVQRFIALGLPKNESPHTIISPKLLVDVEKAKAVLDNNKLTQEKKILVLCPGAEFGVSKQWPVEHYANVANDYLSDGWQVWLMGSASDISICRDINQRTQHKAHLLAGQTTLPEAIDLMSLAQLVVSNDSGLMHIAAALKIPLVAIYGSTDPAHTPPLSDNSTIVRLGLECSPCFQRECPLQHLNCLRGLEPEQVLEAARRLLV